MYQVIFERSGVCIAGDPAGRPGVVPGLGLQDGPGHHGLQPGGAASYYLRQLAWILWRHER